MSLRTCIKKAGKALKRDDRDAIETIYEAKLTEGLA